MTARVQFDIQGRDRTGPAWQSTRQKAQGFKRFLATTFRGGLLGGVGVGVAAAFGLQKFNAALAEYDILGKRARTSGLSVEFYQTLSEAAHDASVDQGVFNSSLDAAIARVGELKAGYGAAATNLARLDEGLANSIKSATSQEQVFRLAADAINREADADQRATLAKTLFSRAGLGMVRVLEEGSAGLDKTAERAKALGLIIDKDLIDNAEKVQTEYARATRILDVQFKSALVELAPWISSVATGVADLARAWRAWTNRDVPLASDGMDKLRSKMAAINVQVAEQQKRVDRGLGAVLNPFGLSKPELEKAKQRLDELKAIRAGFEMELMLRERLAESRTAPQLSSSIALQTNPLLPRPMAKPTGEKFALLQLELQQKQAARAAAAASAREAAEEAAAERKRAKEEAEAEALAIQNVVDSLTFESQQLRRSSLDREVHSRLREAGIGLADKEAGKIVDLVRQMDAYRKEKERTARISSDVRDAGIMAFDAISDSIDRSNNKLKDFAIQLALVTAKAALFGTGGSNTGLLGSLFSSAFAGFFADGGRIPAGQFGVVGEQGVELVSGPATVFPNSVLTGGGSYSGGNVTVAPVFQIDLGGQSDDMLPKVYQMMQVAFAEFESRIPALVTEGQSRLATLRPRGV